VSADLPIELSASAYGGVALEEALDVFVAAGADGVELAIGPRWSFATRATLVARARDGLRFAGHHAFVGDPTRRPFDLDPGLTGCRGV
jgi:sugar phosphate isomerase/epimerase